MALFLAAVLLVFDTGSQPPPEPASTSTPGPVPPASSAVPPPTTPFQVDQGSPGERKGNRGDNGKKPKGDSDG